MPSLCSDLDYLRGLLKEYSCYLNQESKESLRNTILHFIKSRKKMNN